MDKTILLLLAAILFLCRRASGFATSAEDSGELIKLRNLQVDTELCFIRKVKQYCDSNLIMNDEQFSPATVLETDAKLTKPTKSLSYSEDQLYEKLFKFYQKNSVAKMEDGGPVQVTVGLTLIQINNLDEKGQVLTTSGWMEVTWNDERLSWQDEPAFSDIPSIVLGANTVWLPDMALQNSATDIYHSSLVDHKFRVNVYSDGSILWIPGGKYYTNCELDISYFPFDDQICKLHFTNWAYSGAEMNLTIKEDVINLQNYQTNGEWEIILTTAKREDKFYDCCGDTPYPSIYFTIYMRRKYLFYITNILAPCVMLSLLVTLVFYLPPEAGEKISLSITVLLSCTVFLLLIAESIPKRSDSVPIISIYLAVFLAITTASISCTVIVLHIHNMGVQRVPRLLKIIVFDMLARLLCMSELSSKYGVSKCCVEAASSDNTIYSSAIHNPRPSVLANRKSTSYYRSSPSPLVRRQKSNANGTASGMRKSLSITDERLANQILVRRDTVLEELLMHIKTFAAERAQSERTESLREEWRAAAKVLDRFFMLVFISLISLSSAFILIMLPMSKPALVPENI